MIKSTEIDSLLTQLSECKGIHIECNQEIMEEFFRYMQMCKRQENPAFLLNTDRGYERYSVRSYINFFHKLLEGERPVDAVLETFNLVSIQKKLIRNLKQSEKMRVQLARVSMQKSSLYFLQDPFLNLDEEGIKKVLVWIDEQCEKGSQFITLHTSLRHALLLPGTSYYMDNGKFCEVEQDEDAHIHPDQEIKILKIPAKSGNSTLLFEPKDIDYIESLNKSTYLSVRGSLFQTQQTMYELEEILKKSGFFRCHRSYLVNIQKVERYEKWTKNSYVLILNNEDKSQIPLSKGRIDEMKETFHW